MFCVRLGGDEDAVERLVVAATESFSTHQEINEVCFSCSNSSCCLHFLGGTSCIVIVNTVTDIPRLFLML